MCAVLWEDFAHHARNNYGKQTVELIVKSAENYDELFRDDNVRLLEKLLK